MNVPNASSWFEVSRSQMPSDLWSRVLLRVLNRVRSWLCCEIIDAYSSVGVHTKILSVYNGWFYRVFCFLWRPLRAYKTRSFTSSWVTSTFLSTYTENYIEQGPYYGGKLRNRSRRRTFIESALSAIYLDQYIINKLMSNLYHHSMSRVSTVSKALPSVIVLKIWPMQLLLYHFWCVRFRLCMSYNVPTRHTDIRIHYHGWRRGVRKYVCRYAVSCIIMNRDVSSGLREDLLSNSASLWTDISPFCVV